MPQSLQRRRLVSTGVPLSLLRVSMMNEPPTTLHVALGAALGVALKGLVSPVVALDDNVLMGPSSTDARRHQALRARYWKSSPFPDLDHDLGGLGPICVHVPPTPSALLALCQVCFLALEHEREREVLVVDLGSALPASSRGTDPAREIVLDATAVLQPPPPAIRWSKLETAFAATLWTLWCRRSPTAFSRFCAVGSALHPLISDLSRYHAGMFPRLLGQGLVPARFDELLLRQLSREWTTPVQLYASAMRGASELVDWISHTGDVYVTARLRAWSRHTKGRIVERRKERPRNPSYLTEWSFRWHRGGEAILDGLPSLDAAPPVEIGGAVAYEPDRPWVSRVDAEGAHVSVRRRLR
jgi:hypothetical protein